MESDMTDGTVKQDINFLEKPLWFQQVRNAGVASAWTDIDGYEYRTGYTVPDKVDMLILLSLLVKVQQNEYNPDLVVSRYSVLKRCGMTLGKTGYLRLEDSLKRWENVSISFQGSFYDGKVYKSLHFGIVNTSKVREDGNIEAEFNKEWLLQIKNSTFFKYLNFEYYKALKRPLSRRLFEILCKTFKGRDRWSIGVAKLGTKLTLSGRTKQGDKKIMYASDVLVAVKPAINEINRLARINDIAEKAGLHPDDLFTIDHAISGEKQDRIIHFTKRKRTVSIQKPCRDTIGDSHQQQANTIEKPAKTESVKPASSAEKTFIGHVAAHGTDLATAMDAVKTHGLTGANEIFTAAIARHAAKPKRDFAAYLAQSFRRGWGLKSDAKRAEERLKAERMAARAVKFEKAQSEKTKRERAEQKREEESQAQIQTEWNRLDALVDSLTPDLYEALKIKVIGNNREFKPELLKVRMRKTVEEFLTQDR